jgi:hypothetical protein
LQTPQVLGSSPLAPSFDHRERGGTAGARTRKGRKGATSSEDRQKGGRRAGSAGRGEGPRAEARGRREGARGGC